MFPIKIGMKVVGNNLLPMVFDLTRNCHVLICGRSGTGKSYALKLIFRSLLDYQDRIDIFCLDFKNSGDYSFMDPPHLSYGKQCVEMLNDIYERFVEIKEKNLPTRILVCFDEYAAFLHFLNGVDKKLGKKAMDQVSEILMMGRRLNQNGGAVYMWTVLQRPDAEYFGNSRENYMVKIVMCDITRSIRTMLEIDEAVIPKEHVAKPGHGIVVVDDQVYAFVVPVYDEAKMTAMLKAKRSGAKSIAAET